MRLPGGPGNTTRGEGVRRGVGFAVGFKNIGYSEGFDDYSAARVRLFADGRAEVHCAAAEVGQGVTGVILQVARTELGTEDVALAPRHDGDGRLGGLGVGVADDVDGVGRRPRRVPRRARGARARTAAARWTSSAIYRHPRTSPLDPETGQTTGERSHVAFARAAMSVVAEVDVELGLTRVVWIGTAQDVGKAVNPQAVDGPDRGRHGAGPRPRADGGDPDA